MPTALRDPAGPGAGEALATGGPLIERVRLSAFTIPTDQPESDGTLEWTSTTLVLAEITAGDKTGVGYTYAPAATAVLARDSLAPLLEGQPVARHGALWHAMIGAVRNMGLPGVAACAISALDNALWDLRGRLLDTPLIDLLGRVREALPVYGSGGFTSYDEATLCRQLAGWVESGIGAVKMKVARESQADLGRVRAARRAIGGDAGLMVDANNAYAEREAVDWAHRFHEAAGVSWLEQPIPDENVRGMAFVRRQVPGGIDITDGEYGFTPSWFARRIEAGAADVLMPDITRCLGLSGFLQIAALCEAADIPMSSHCAPALHATAGCVVRNLRHCEYFHDHARIEQAVFEGALRPDSAGLLRPTDRPGFGLEFKRADAERMAA